MGCDNLREHFSEYLDGRLEAALMRKIDDHLKICPLCKKEFDGLSFTRAVLRGLDEIKAPPNFVLALQQRIEMAQTPWWKRAAKALDRGLEAIPLRAMTAAAAAVFALIIAIGAGNQAGKNHGVPDGKIAAIQPAYDDLDGDTHAVTAKLVGTNPEPLVVETPTEFLLSVIKNDPELSKYKPIPHPRGNGVLIDTHVYLFEVLMDPVEFPVIQANIEMAGGEMPQTLREAMARYPIYIRKLPSPTGPVTSSAN